MAAALYLGGSEGPWIQIHDEIGDYLRRAGQAWGLRLDLLLGLDPHGDERTLSAGEIDQLRGEATATAAD